MPVPLAGADCIPVQVMRAGSGTSTRPSQQSRVKVRTRGFLESGDVVDKHNGYWFTVGDGDVVQGMLNNLRGVVCMNGVV